MKITLLGTSHGDPTLTRQNSSSLIECEGKYYLVDAGEGASTSLIRLGLRPSMISAVFITHMHGDHTNGLSLFADQARKYRKLNPEHDTEIYFPDERAEIPFRQWLSVIGYTANQDVRIHTIHPGKFFDDGVLQVEAFPTRHMVWSHKDESLPSYAFLISGEGKKILFTGDLSGDFSDFPVEMARRADLMICEIVHFKPEYALPIFRELKLKQLVFNHLSNFAQTPEGQKEIAELCKDLPYPIHFGFDGYAFVP